MVASALHALKSNQLTHKTNTHITLDVKTNVSYTIANDIIRAKLALTMLPAMAYDTLAFLYFFYCTYMCKYYVYKKK